MLSERAAWKAVHAMMKEDMDPEGFGFWGGCCDLIQSLSYDGKITQRMEKRMYARMHHRAKSLGVDTDPDDGAPFDYLWPMGKDGNKRRLAWVKRLITRNWGRE
jgi:hypothetical protein